MAQTNIGYNHIGKTLEILNIELGSLYERHAKAMDKKVFFMTNNKKKKRNSREGITSYLNKKPRKHSGGKSVKGSPMSLQQV